MARKQATTQEEELAVTARQAEELDSAQVNRSQVRTHRLDRIYVVKEIGPNKEYEDSIALALVRASSQAQAIGHLVRDRFKAEVASQDDIVKLIANGVVVQETSRE